MLFFCLTAFAQEVVRLPVHDPSRHEWKFTPGDSIGPFQLPHQLLFENAVTVLAGERELQPKLDFTVHTMNGLLFLTQPLPGVELQVNYRAAAIQLDRRLFRYQLQTPDSNSSNAAIPFQAVDRTEVSATESESGEIRLNRSGSLLRAVNVGSGQDVGIESALRLEVDGNISRDVELSAVLSDQSTGLPDATNTQTLREFDRIYLQARAPRWQVTMGDYALPFGVKNRFLDFTRQVQGADFIWREPRNSAQISGAITRARSRTQVFTGLEGFQGPFLLTSEDNVTIVPVVPSSEHVFINGEAVSRGENADYTIDYSTGELIFTPRRPIRKDDRILIEFEALPGAYNRNLAAFQASGRTVGHRFEWSAAYLREADDERSLLLGTLDSITRAAIQNAGDSSTFAWVDGARYVGNHHGDYTRIDSIISGTTYRVYRFVAPDSAGGTPRGDYTVTFTKVAGGHYRFDFDPTSLQMIYTWVAPPGVGEYEPVMKVSLPQQREIAGISGKYRPIEGLQITLQTAASRFDANRLSSSNQPSTGGAIESSTEYTAPVRDGWSRWSASARFRQVEKAFSPATRGYNGEEFRRWGSTDTLGSTGELAREVQLSWSPLRVLHAQANAGLRATGDGFRAERSALQLMLNHPTLTMMNSVERINSSSDQSATSDRWLIAKHRQRWTRGALSATYASAWEDRNIQIAVLNSANRKWENTFNVAVENWKQHRGNLEYNWRDDWQTLAAKRLASTFRSDEYRLEHAFSGTQLVTNSTFTHRKAKYLLADSASINDLFRHSGTWNESTGASSAEWNYSLNRARTSKLAIYGIYVGRGRGDHIRIADQFIPDPNGDWIVNTRVTGDYEPVIDLQTTIGLRSRLNRYWQIFPENVTTDTRIEVIEQAAANDPKPYLLLNVTRLLSSQTRYGRQSLYQEFGWEPSRKNAYRLRSELSRDLENRLYSGGSERRGDRHSVWYRHTLSSIWTYSVETNREWQLRRYLAGASSAARNFTSYKLQPQLLFRPDTKYEFKLDGVISTNRDTPAKLRWTETGAVFSLTYFFKAIGRAYGEVESRALQSNTKSLPYDLTGGRQPGVNYRWMTRSDFRLGTNLNGSLYYRGIKDFQAPVYHEGRAEMVAFF